MAGPTAACRTRSDRVIGYWVRVGVQEVCGGLARGLAGTWEPLGCAGGGVGSRAR